MPIFDIHTSNPHTHTRTPVCTRAQRPPSGSLRPQDRLAHPHHLPKDRRSMGVNRDALIVQRAAEGRTAQVVGGVEEVLLLGGWKGGSDG
jgi:hypothetical protein